MLLRQAYATGSSLAPLRTRLGRSRTSISFQAKTMGLHGTHIRHNGWCIEPPWTEAELEMLRRDYGRVRTVDLAAALHRSKGGVFNKAFSLGLKHGFMRAFTEDEDRAIAIAHEHVLSITDLAAALGRDVAVVSKHAIRMGLPFSGRTLLAPRGRLIDRQRWTLRSILALGAGQARVLTMLTQAEDQDEARVDNSGA